MQRRSKSYVRPRYYRQWTEEEETALQRGVERHGVGSWESIRKDPELGILRERTGVQLKDKWRNMVKFKHVPHVLATKTPSTEGSRHSESLSGALRCLDLRNASEDAQAPALTTDDDLEGSTRSGSRHGRKSRTRRPQSALEDKRYGIYDVRRYLNKSASADLATLGTPVKQEDDFAATTTTSTTPGSPSAGSCGEEQGVVRCVCGAHVDDGLMMVECERCFVWSHIHCLQELAASTCFQLNLEHYICAGCQGLNVQNLMETMASCSMASASHPNQHLNQHPFSTPREACHQLNLSPFASLVPPADSDIHLSSEESLMDSLAAYHDHPEGKVHGGSLAMYALAATSLDAATVASDDLLFADMPGLDHMLADATTGGATITQPISGQHAQEQQSAEDEFGVWGMVLPDDTHQHASTPCAPVPMTAPRSCPQPSPMMMSWPLQHVYGGGALAASLSSGMAGNISSRGPIAAGGPMSVGSATTTVMRGNSPPSSISYASSGDLVSGFGSVATPPSAAKGLLATPGGGHSSHGGKRMLSAPLGATHHVARGGVSKVTAGGMHRLDTTSTSSLEYMSKTWFPEHTTTSTTPPAAAVVHDAGSPSTIDSHASHLTPPVPAPTTAAPLGVVADADLSALDVVLFSEQEWPLP